MMKILITAEQIQSRVAELGRDISACYQGEPLTLIALMNGAMIFAADLARQIQGDLFVDSLAVASYHADASSGAISFRGQLKLPVNNRHLLVVDGVLDSGLTLLTVARHLAKQNPISVKTCVIVEKNIPRKHPFQADWRGFLMPDYYLVGYGLDSCERYRNCPDIAVLEK